MFLRPRGCKVICDADNETEMAKIENVISVVTCIFNSYV